MDDLLAPVQDIFEGQIDFQGQRITEIIYTVLMVVSGVCATIVGYSYQDVYLAVWIGLAGALVTTLAVVPPWPMYNKNPEKWFDPTSKPAGDSPGVVVDGVKVS